MKPEDVTLEWLHTRVKEDAGCLVWTGCSGSMNANPQAHVGSVTVLVRRLLWSLVHEAPVPKRHRISMVCQTDLCVHPDHLAALRTNAVLRGLVRSQASKANVAKAKRAGSKWPDEVVKAIRASDETLKTLAARYGMHPSYAHLIRTGAARRDLCNPYHQLAAGAR